MSGWRLWRFKVKLAIRKSLEMHWYYFRYKYRRWMVILAILTILRKDSVEKMC